MSKTDRLILRNLTFYGYHGCEPAERQLGQRFEIDVALTLDLEPAGRSDDLALTIDDSAVFPIIRDIVEGPPCNLIETVAERIATAILQQKAPLSVWVRVCKPGVPIRGMVHGDVAVEITRSAV
jgi:dihydroneopterin aldolase